MCDGVMFCVAQQWLWGLRCGYVSPPGARRRRYCVCIYTTVTVVDSRFVRTCTQAACDKLTRTWALCGENSFLGGGERLGWGGGRQAACMCFDTTRRLLGYISKRGKHRAPRCLRKDAILFLVFWVGTSTKAASSPISPPFLFPLLLCLCVVVFAQGQGSF